MTTIRGGTTIQTYLSPKTDDVPETQTEQPDPTLPTDGFQLDPSWPLPGTSCWPIPDSGGPELPMPLPGTNCWPRPGQFPPSQFPEQPDPSAQWVKDRKEFKDACETLLKGFPLATGELFSGPMGTIDIDDLTAAAHGERGPEMEKAAKFLLAHPDMLRELDTANEGGSPDGKISLFDLTSQMGRLKSEGKVNQLQTDNRLPELQNSLQTLLLNKEAVDGAADGDHKPDGKISNKDLYAVLNDPSAAPDLKAAAAFFLKNQDLMDMLDTAHKGGGRDGIVSYDDLEALNEQVSHLRSNMLSPIRANQNIQV